MRFSLAGLPAALAAACTISACAPDASLSPTDNSDDGFRVLAAATKANGKGPQDCPPDNKLLGRFSASTADTPGTWWRLTRDRFDALGITDYEAALEGFYGLNFGSLAEAKQFLIDGVAGFDANGNGYVCGYDTRGTRAYLGINAYYLFGISDDKHAQ